MNQIHHNLVIVAHPDDETIYFSGLIQQERERPWKIICVTDGNADGQQQERNRQFQKACQAQGVREFEQWDFPDVFDQRLDTKRLEERLKELPTPSRVYTHGILGEYGHPHHQDVSYATHNAFQAKCDVFSIAYNCFPDQLIQLEAENFKKKNEILVDIYGSELNRFLNLVPSQFCEGFSKIDLEEVRTIYHSLTQKVKLNLKHLSRYKWLAEHIEQTLMKDQQRLF